MPASTAHASAELALMLNGTAIPDLAENDSTSPATTLTIALHTADPGVGNDMTSNEASYEGYDRVTQARTSGGFVVSGNVANPASNIEFPAGGVDASQSVTHWSIGSGVGDNLMYIGILNPAIFVTEGVIPVVTTESTITKT